MVNGISSYQNYNSTSSNSIAPTSTETSSTPSNQGAEITQSPRQENLYLSSKAQKINALNNEFFQSGISVDVSALAERAYQYGLINKSEYEQFNDTRTPENEIKEPAGTTTENLVSFTHQFQDKIDKALESPEEYEQEEKNLFASLKEALNSAAVVLKDIEKAKMSPDFKESLNQTITSLKDTIKTEVFERLPLDDKVNIVKITKSLDIIDKITAQRLTNSKVNLYLDISMR